MTGREYRQPARTGQESQYAERNNPDAHQPLDQAGGIVGSETPVEERRFQAFQLVDGEVRDEKIEPYRDKSDDYSQTTLVFPATGLPSDADQHVDEVKMLMVEKFQIVGAPVA